MKTKKIQIFVSAVVAATLIIGSIPENAYASFKISNEADYTLTTSEAVYLDDFNEDGLSLYSSDSEDEENSVLFLIDADNTKKLPINFRTTKQDLFDKNTENINLTGLSCLNMSGSGALSTKGLDMIKKQINKYQLVDIDLRKESHGVVNGYAVSWYGENNDANNGLSDKEIIKDEKTKFRDIRKAGYVEFDYDESKSASDILELNKIKTAEPESQMVKDAKVKYLRIMVSDPLKPSNDSVDQFVKEVNKLSKDKKVWLHFHCRNGIGRTTAFMCMYDMMNNAKKVSYNDILKRQALIGGFDYLAAAEAQHIRLEFLESFYDYCKNNNDNFKTSYSKYMKNK